MHRARRNDDGLTRPGYELFAVEQELDFAGLDIKTFFLLGVNVWWNRLRAAARSDHHFNLQQFAIRIRRRLDEFERFARRGAGHNVACFCHDRTLRMSVSLSYD